jgi:hypothetical protein
MEETDMRDEAKKTRQESELAGEAMPRGAMSERGTMPMEDQGPEVAGHAQTMADQPMAPETMGQKGRQPAAEDQAQQRGAPMRNEQAI